MVAKVWEGLGAEGWSREAGLESCMLCACTETYQWVPLICTVNT